MMHWVLIVAVQQKAIAVMLSNGRKSIIVTRTTYVHTAVL